ncbi:hypothetical protein [Kistimonas asteriae]|uniref:hypothetical protein n=1 Tax=Kistimonas asteriae TaxID=517724 RepID=UPI001BA89A9A|nr:hypothetical protein [Kistimonas asteriae]
MPKTQRKSLGFSPDYSTQKRQNFGIDIHRLSCSLRKNLNPSPSPFKNINITTGARSISLDHLNRTGIIYYRGQAGYHHPTIKTKNLHQFKIDKDYIQSTDKRMEGYDDPSAYIIKKEVKPDEKTLQAYREIGKRAFKNEAAFSTDTEDGLLHTTRRALSVQVLAQSLGAGHVFVHADLAQMGEDEFGLLMPFIKGITIEEWLNQHNLITLTADEEKKDKINRLKKEPSRYWDTDFKETAYKAFKHHFGNHPDLRLIGAIDQLCGQIDHVKLTNIMVTPSPKTLTPLNENVKLIAIDNDLAFPEYADDVLPIQHIRKDSSMEGPAFTFPKNPCCQLWIDRLCELLKPLCPVRLDRFKKELSDMFPTLPEQCHLSSTSGSPISTGISSGRATPDSDSSPKPSTSKAKSVHNISDIPHSSHAMLSENVRYHYEHPELWLSSDSSDDEQDIPTLPFKEQPQTEPQPLLSGGFDISNIDITLLSEHPDYTHTLPTAETSSHPETVAGEVESLPSLGFVPSLGYREVQNLPSLGFVPSLSLQEEQTEQETFPSPRRQEDVEESSDIPVRKKPRRSSDSDA